MGRGRQREVTRFLVWNYDVKEIRRFCVDVRAGWELLQGLLRDSVLDKRRRQWRRGERTDLRREQSQHLLVDEIQEVSGACVQKSLRFPSMLLQMALPFFKKWLGNIPLSTCTTSSLCIPLLMDIQASSFFWLLLNCCSEHRVE